MTFRQLSRPLVGGLAFAGLVLNTLLWFPLLMATAVVRLAMPFGPVVRVCRAAAAWIATNWIGFNIFGLRLVGNIAWRVDLPDDLRRDGSYLLVSNHVSAVDIVIVQWVFHRRIPLVKFFLKRELIWVPLLGLAWWALEFPFMRRYKGAILQKRPDLRRKDLETTRRICARFRGQPTTFLNFVEGTRFTEAKRDRQASPYRHLLLPRAGGVAQVVSSMGSQLDGLLDVTIAYPGGIPKFWDLISGQIPAVWVRVERIPVEPSWIGRDYHAEPEFREAFQQFVRELWSRKDSAIGDF